MTKLMQRRQKGRDALLAKLLKRKVDARNEITKDELKAKALEILEERGIKRT